MHTVKKSTTASLKLFILGSFLAVASNWHAVASAQELEQTFTTQLSELKTKVERLEAAVKEILSGKPEGISASSPDAAMNMKSKGGKGMEAGKGMDMDGQKSQAKQDGKGMEMKGMEMKGMAMGNDGEMTEKKGMGAMAGNEAAMGSSALVPIYSQMIQMQMIKMKMMEMQVKMMEMQMKMKMMELN